MRPFFLLLLLCLASLVLPVSCVDQLDLSLRGTVDVVVVDGTITERTYYRRCLLIEFRRLCSSA